MWKPPNARKHPIPEARWPGAEEAEKSRLFTPMSVGPITIEQRTWVPAMVPWRATEEGEVTDELVEWYARFAEGQPGVIVIEATGIRDIPSGPLLRIGDDRYIDGLKRIVEGVRQASGGQTRLFIQLIDFLTVKRRPPAEKYFSRFLKITDNHRQALGLEGEEAIREALISGDDELHQKVLSRREYQSLAYGYREQVNDTHLPSIADLPDTLPNLFAEAAVRAKKAGFDGIELHYAHAYTMASFLSRTNVRTDGYGGSPENRVRLPLEVYGAVREAVGDNYVVGCRFLVDEVFEGGSRINDAQYYGVEFARAGMDFISMSKGGKFDDARQPRVGRVVYPYTGESGYECMPTIFSDELGPFGRNIALMSQVRQAIRKAGYQTPTVVAGGLNDFHQVEAILQHGHGDIIGSARQSLADPDWWLKMKTGTGQDIARCVMKNYCEGLDNKHKQVTCQLWDRINIDEPGVRLSHDGRRRLTPP